MPPVRNDDDITQILPQMTNERCGLRLLSKIKITIACGVCFNCLFLETVVRFLFFSSVSGKYETFLNSKQMKPAATKWLRHNAFNQPHYLVINVPSIFSPILIKPFRGICLDNKGN